MRPLTMRRQTRRPHRLGRTPRGYFPYSVTQLLGSTCLLDKGKPTIYGALKRKRKEQHKSFQLIRSGSGEIFIGNPASLRKANFSSSNPTKVLVHGYRRNAF